MTRDSIPSVWYWYVVLCSLKSTWSFTDVCFTVKRGRTVEPYCLRTTREENERMHFSISFVVCTTSTLLCMCARQTIEPTTGGNCKLRQFLTFVVKMKLSGVAILLAVSGAAAYQQPSRKSLRSLGSKSVNFNGPSRKVGASMKMEGEYEIFGIEEIVQRSPLAFS